MPKNKVTAKLILHSRKESKGRQLKLIITKNRRSKYKSLGFYIKKYEEQRYWSEKSGLSTKYPDYKAVMDKYNKEVEKLKFNKLYHGDIIHDKTNNNTLNNSLSHTISLPVTTNSLYFIEYWKQRRDHLDTINKTGNARKHSIVINSLLNFTNNNDIEFKDLNKRILVQYMEWLEQKKLQPVTIKSYLQTLKSAINHAIKSDYFTPDATWKHPFNNFKMPTVNTRPKHLEIKQFELFEDELMNGNKLSADARKSGLKWLFQYYMFGMRVGDLLTLKWKNIIDDGARLKYTMRKNTKDNNIELNYNAAKIICLYHGFPVSESLKTMMFNIYLKVQTKKDDYIFSNISKKITEKQLHQAIENRISLYNKDLKTTSNEFNSYYHEDIRLTTHMARHQFAYNARLFGTDIYLISKALQHGSIKTTETYLGKFTFPDLDGKFYQKKYSKQEKNTIDERLDILLKLSDYSTKEKILSQFKG